MLEEDLLQVLYLSFSQPFHIHLSSLFQSSFLLFSFCLLFNQSLCLSYHLLCMFIFSIYLSMHFLYIFLSIFLFIFYLLFYLYFYLFPISPYIFPSMVLFILYLSFYTFNYLSSSLITYKFNFSVFVITGIGALSIILFYQSILLSIFYLSSIYLLSIFLSTFYLSYMFSFSVFIIT